MTRSSDHVITTCPKNADVGSAYTRIPSIQGIGFEDIGDKDTLAKDTYIKDA